MGLDKEFYFGLSYLEKEVLEKSWLHLCTRVFVIQTHRNATLFDNNVVQRPYYYDSENKYLFLALPFSVPV